MTTYSRILTLILPISILFICGIKVYFNNSLSNCDGLIQGFVDLFLLLILLFLNLIFIGIQFYKIKRGAINRKARIFAILIIIIATSIAFQDKETWKNFQLKNSLLKAIISLEQLDIGQIELIDGKKYYAKYGHLDWSCSYTNNYKIIGDTLILEGNLFAITDGILTNNYIITDSTLIPIFEKNIKMNRTEILIIKKLAKTAAIPKAGQNK